MSNVDDSQAAEIHQAQHAAIQAEAMALAESGWPLVPLQPHDAKVAGAGKAPRQKGWQNRGPTTIEEMEEWLSGCPEMNLGLVMGSASGLVGIDADGPGGELILHEKSAGDLPRTWTYRTPHGRRLLYELPDGFRSQSRQFKATGREHEECSLLAEGKQTVIPPSIGPDGTVYAWEEGCSPDEMEQPAPAPPWLLDLIAVKPSADEAVLDKLAGQCPVFARLLAEQKQGGVSEDEWFLVVGLLVAADKSSAALRFSSLSSKHDERSESRIVQLVSEGRTGMTRCTTFGCSAEQVAKCHGGVRYNESGDIVNSPGAFLRSADTTESIREWPVDEIYAPYIAQLKGTAYQLGPDGILYYTGGKSDDVMVANFIARVVTQITKDDGLATDVWFEVEGVAQGGRPLPRISVPSRELQYANWVSDQWGIDIIIYPGKRDHLVTAIRTASQGAARETIYSHTGWRRVDDDWVYLHGGGAVGGKDVSVELDGTLRRYELPTQSESPGAATRASLDLLDLAPRRVTIPLQAIVYLAPLCELLRSVKLEPNFAVWLYGRTGTRKTSLSMLYLNHFGDFGRSSPPASFKDTSNALERKASQAKDAVLLVDDFHPAASVGEAAVLNGTGQRLLRMLGDRVGRGRLDSGARGLRTEYVPRGMVIVTGEDMIGGHSSVARLFAVELLPDDIDLARLTEAQNSSHLLAEAMLGYLQFLQPQMEELPAKLEERFLELREAFQQAVHGRLAEAVAWLLLAYETMLDYLQATGVIDETEAETLAAEAWDTLAELMEDQNRLLASETPGEKFLAGLNEMLASGAIEATVAPGQSKRVYYCRKEAIGWQEGNSSCFLPQSLYKAVTGWINQRGGAPAVSEAVLWKQLDAMHVLVTDTGERVNRTVKRTPPWEKDKRRRVLVILNSALCRED